MRLIDADALLSNVETRRKYLGTFGEEDYGAVCYGMQQVEELINSAPTVETTDDVLDMNVKQFVPTEEELLSLGFKKTQDFTRQNGGKKLEDWEIRGRYSGIRVCLSENWNKKGTKLEPRQMTSLHGYIYPKSFEELRLLISMMNP